MFEIAVNGVDRPLDGRAREICIFTPEDADVVEIDPAVVLVFAAPEA